MLGYIRRMMIGPYLLAQLKLPNVHQKVLNLQSSEMNGCSFGGDVTSCRARINFIIDCHCFNPMFTSYCFSVPLMLTKSIKSSKQ